LYNGIIVTVYGIIIVASKSPEQILAPLQSILAREYATSGTTNNSPNRLKKVSNAVFPIYWKYGILLNAAGKFERTHFRGKILTGIENASVIVLNEVVTITMNGDRNTTVRKTTINQNGTVFAVLIIF
jgi:hypothetical protein